ncbi:MAG TPA: helix-turn-helix domain-containing protein [Candidatus Paceibacterota bacterium]|nr:helix-turn-helix domain-containing protein [Candidatus Paceibacterota bacterium]
MLERVQLLWEGTMLATQQPLLPFTYLPLVREEDDKPAKVSYRNLLRLVCAEFGIEESELCGESRVRKIARPRQVLMYLAHFDARKSYPWIGARIGGRDHTTALHGKRKIEELLAAGDTAIRESIGRIQEQYTNA